MSDGLDAASAPRDSRPPLIVVAYDPAWPQAFAAARAEILEAVGPDVKCVEHVGSTSVEGLDAKPIIDILVGVKDWHEATVTIAPLERVGWEFRGERGIPRRHYFVKRTATGRRTHHLHMLEVGTDRYTEMLAFRDYLRVHPDAAAQYAALKRALASRPLPQRGDYTDAKAPFIQDVLAQVRARRGTEHCAHPSGSEWPAPLT